MLLEEDNLDISGDLLSEMRLLVEGMILLFEDDTTCLNRLATEAGQQEARNALNDIGGALYGFLCAATSRVCKQSITRQQRRCYRMSKIKRMFDLRIKAHMTEHGVDTLITTDTKTTWKTVTSSRIDTTTLEKQLPEVADVFTKETTPGALPFSKKHNDKGRFASRLLFTGNIRHSCRGQMNVSKLARVYGQSRAAVNKYYKMMG